MNNTTKKHALSPDLIKLIACVVVVIVHSSYFIHFPEDGLTLRSLYFNLAPVANPMFFMVTGFFMFRTDNTFAVWKRSLLRVGLPGLGIVLVFHYLGGYLFDGIPFSETELFTFADTKALFISIITLKEAQTYWFVFAYLWVCIAFPVLKGLADFLGASEKRERNFLIITLILLIINDATGNQLLDFGFSGLPVCIPSCLTVLWGHILYKHRNLLTETRIRLLLWAAFLVSAAIHFPLTPVYESAGLGGYQAYWFTSMSMVSAFSATGLLLPAFLKDKEYPGGKVISYLASYSYSMYLVHPFYLALVRRRGVSDWIYDTLYHGNGILYSITSMLLVLAVLYPVSLLTCILLRGITKLFTLPFRKSMTSD